MGVKYTSEVRSWPETIKLVSLIACLALPFEAYGQYSEALRKATFNGRITGEALGETCRTGNNGSSREPRNRAFQGDCNLIVGGSGSDSDGSAQALTDIASDQISAQNAGALRTSRVNVAIITNRLGGIRVASGVSAYSQDTTLAANDLFRRQTSGGASGDATFGRFGAFLNGQYVTGDEDTTRFQPGYDFNGWNLAGGLDYKFTDDLVAGLALQYADGDVDFDSNRGFMPARSWGLSAYGTYFLPSGLYFDGMIGYRSVDYTLRRQITYEINDAEAIQTARSDPDADLWNLSLGGGYTLYKDAWSFTPLARVDYLRNKVDGYGETMSGPTETGSSMAMAIDSQTYTSLRSNVGIRIGNAIKHARGVIVPQLRLAWVHEFRNDQKGVGARFVNDINQTPFFVATNKPVRDYLDLGVGVSAQFAEGRTGFLHYQALLGYDDLTYNAISAGVRMEF